jgi:hypothetical protein
MKTKFLNGLTYTNARKVQEFVDNNTSGTASISTGCLRIELNDEDWIKTEKFIMSLGVEYSLTDEHQYY